MNFIQEYSGLEAMVLSVSSAAGHRTHFVVQKSIIVMEDQSDDGGDWRWTR